MFYFKKGYKHDAGIDIICQKRMVFPPLQTTIYDLSVACCPKKGQCALLIARTSAAKKGLIVSMCPIDADYTGSLTAIVFNGSKETIVYEKGESFSQIVFVKLSKSIIPKSLVRLVAKKAKRETGNFGSTDRC